MVVSATTDSLLQQKLPLSNYEIGQLTAFLNTLTDLNTRPKFTDTFCRLVD